MATVTRVLFVPYRGVAVTANVSPLKWKRRAVWDNAGRNGLVAGLAAGLAKHPLKTLRGLGVGAGGVKLPGRSNRRVVVLAETAEQAGRLAKLLPGWAALDAVPVESDEAGWENDLDPDDAPPPGAIATLTYAARHGVTCDILVRATAGTGRLNWAAIRARSNKAGTTPALVVDIGDRSGGREHTDAEVRRREYREQGLKELKAAPGPKSRNQNT